MRLLVIISILLGNYALAQYNPIQSQYMFNPIVLNPAAAGTENTFSIQASLRSQWTGFPGAPKTENLSFHAPVKNENAAFGMQLYAAQIGIDRNTGLFGIYAYRLRFENSDLRIGLSAGVNFRKSYYSRLDVIDNQDELLLNDSPLGILPDASFGLHYSNNKFFVSFALPQFLSHTYNGQNFQLGNDFRDYNFTLGSGYNFEFENGIALKPSFLAKYKIASAPQFDFNLMARLSEGFSMGLSYRTNEALILLLQVKFAERLSLMYSFGLPMNQLITYTYGSHEIGLKFNFKYNTKLSNPRYLGW